MRHLDKDELEQLERAWREGSDALWSARQELARAETVRQRDDAESKLRRAEIQVANARAALLLFGIER